jgi:hypothetical protein
MGQSDRHEKDFQGLDDLQLESLRVEMLNDKDERLEALIRVLVMRAVPMIERICRVQGDDLGLGRIEINRAIEDASTRILLRLARPEGIAAISALAARTATSCIQAQQPQPTPRLAPRRPQLRVVNQLGDAVQKGHVKPNDWTSS